MGKFSVFGYFFFALFLTALLFSFYVYLDNTNEEFERLRLMTIVNNASDSALLEATSNESLTLDESLVNPVYCSDTFFDVFMRSYGMSLSEQNRIKVYDYVPLLALICNDGIYLGYPRFINNRTYEFHWEPKIPFLFETPNFLYYMTLNKKGEQRIIKSNPPIYSDVWTDISISRPLNAKELINEIILKSISMAITNANETNPNWKHRFYVPADLANYTTVDFQGVTLMAFVQNVDIYTTRKIDYFSVGGTQLMQADKVVGYVFAGKRYYCYASDTDALTPPITRVFDTVWEAAEAGYRPDLSRIR